MTKKTCFGRLEQVFPVGREGLREVTVECFGCEDRVECLRAAIKTEEGLEMRSENLDRRAPRGLVGRFRKWSEKKMLSRQIEEVRKTKD